MQLAGKKTAILGFGRSGRAAARLALARGASLRVLDRDPAVPEQPEARELAERGVFFDCGPHREDQLGDAELLILSPGVPPSAPPVREARRRGLAVLGELELGARLARGCTSGQALSGGCVRQAPNDAAYMWDWAPIGTPVVVLG